jgi:hypothetical protein
MQHNERGGKINVDACFGEHADGWRGGYSL